MFLPEKATINSAAESNLHIFSSSVQCFENKQLYFADKLQDAMKVKDVSSNTSDSFMGLEESIKRICNVLMFQMSCSGIASGGCGSLLTLRGCVF